MDQLHDFFFFSGQLYSYILQNLGEKEEITCLDTKKSVQKNPF